MSFKELVFEYSHTKNRIINSNVLEQCHLLIIDAVFDCTEYNSTTMVIKWKKKET